jgi:hypothetical protein
VGEVEPAAVQPELDRPLREIGRQGHVELARSERELSRRESEAVLPPGEISGELQGACREGQVARDVGGEDGLRLGREGIAIGGDLRLPLERGVLVARLEIAVEGELRTLPGGSDSEIEVDGCAVGRTHHVEFDAQRQLHVPPARHDAGCARRGIHPHLDVEIVEFERAGRRRRADLEPAVDDGKGALQLRLSQPIEAHEPFADGSGPGQSRHRADDAGAHDLDLAAQQRHEPEP